MSPIPKKLTFMAKYGSEADRAKVSEHVDHLLDRAEKGEPKLFNDLALASTVPLNSNQAHRIIDAPRFPGMVHPAAHLAKFHFGDLKDEHWDKIAKGMKTDASVLSIMPPQHLPTIYNNQNVDPFVRQLAKQHHDRINARDAENE